MTRTPIAALPAGLAAIALSGCLMQMKTFATLATACTS